ncbi:NAD-dependent epimerase/dehydratase family protein [Aquihabitans sp. McL0605]|uniref:NAD-dependent epimerase/dehydratase family protein n=1 Tax=Aquihabitans sp. McL0605 TaxID=3415671 RepID=UPI003CED4222
MRVLITGSSGLIGSEASAHFDSLGAETIGVDNNLRADFFGPDGDTAWNLARLKEEHPRFRHIDMDIRDRQAMLDLFQIERPDVVIHCAAQPSHDLAARRPFDDFDVNAVGTLNLLEATRRFCAESPFVFMSTNKVYGDAPNEVPLVEQPTRWEYAHERDRHGIDESMRIDQSKHSLFGASKAAADLAVQEYGRYFDMPTVCFRGGCLTGPNHASAELHGFLSYLVKTTVNQEHFRIYGYQGKQVRDQIHSRDVLAAFDAFIRAPRAGAVYNLGGGRENSTSVLEAIALAEQAAGVRLDHEYVDEARSGDHICYISDLAKLRADYPDWHLTTSLDAIVEELVEAHHARLPVRSL